MRSSSKRIIFLALPVGGLLLWFFVLRAERSITRWRYYLQSRQPTALQLKAAQALATGRLARTPLNQLTPVNSGVGVVVGEPTLAPASSSLSAFGAGCSRWVELEVGGQPQFGKTPS